MVDDLLALLSHHFSCQPSTPFISSKAAVQAQAVSLWIECKITQSCSQFSSFTCSEGSDSGLFGKLKQIKLSLSWPKTASWWQHPGGGILVAYFPNFCISAVAQHQECTARPPSCKSQITVFSQMG